MYSVFDNRVGDLFSALYSSCGKENAMLMKAINRSYEYGCSILNSPDIQAAGLGVFMLCSSFSIWFGFSIGFFPTFFKNLYKRYNERSQFEFQLDLVNVAFERFNKLPNELIQSIVEIDGRIDPRNSKAIRLLCT
jgi:hypothetical protein